MSAPTVVWLVVGLVTLSILAVMLVGLVRHLKLLGGSLTRFRRETEPVARQIADASASAAERSERLRREWPPARPEPGR